MFTVYSTAKTKRRLWKNLWSKSVYDYLEYKFYWSVQLWLRQLILIAKRQYSSIRYQCKSLMIFWQIAIFSKVFEVDLQNRVMRTGLSSHTGLSLNQSILLVRTLLDSATKFCTHTIKSWSVYWVLWKPLAVLHDLAADRPSLLINLRSRWTPKGLYRLYCEEYVMKNHHKSKVRKSRHRLDNSRSRCTIQVDRPIWVIIEQLFVVNMYANSSENKKRSVIWTSATDTSKGVMWLTKNLSCFCLNVF